METGGEGEFILGKKEEQVENLFSSFWGLQGVVNDICERKKVFVVIIEPDNSISLSLSFF